MKINFMANSINFSANNCNQKEKINQVKVRNFSHKSNDVFVKAAPSFEGRKKKENIKIEFEFDENRTIALVEKLFGTKILPEERERVLREYKNIMNSLTDQARQIYEFANIPASKRQKISKIAEDVHISTKDFYGINNQVLSHLYSSFKYIQERKNAELTIEAYEYSKYFDANLEIGDLINEDELNSQDYSLKIGIMRDKFNIKINAKNRLQWLVRFENAFAKLSESQKAGVFSGDENALSKLEKLIGSFNSLSDAEKNRVMAEYDYYGDIVRERYKLPVITHKIFKEKPDVDKNFDAHKENSSKKTSAKAVLAVDKKYSKPLPKEKLLELLEEKKIMLSDKQYNLLAGYFKSNDPINVYATTFNRSRSRIGTMIREMSRCLQNISLEEYMDAREKLKSDFKTLLKQGKITTPDMKKLVNEHFLADEPKFIEEIFPQNQIRGVRTQLGRMMSVNNIETIIPLMII